MTAYPYSYIIQNNNGVDNINFHRLFDIYSYGTNVERLLNRLWFQVITDDSVGFDAEIKFSEILSKNLKSIVVDKNKLFVRNKVDRLVFDKVISSILSEKESKKTETCVEINFSGNIYFVIGLDENELLNKLKFCIYEIDKNILPKMGEKNPSLLRIALKKIRNYL